jgi:hypothetical protein
MNSYFHARSSVNEWGGEPEDYLPIHSFIDSSKQIIGDVRHRSMYHHTAGIFLCEKIFGPTIETCRGRKVPVRLIAEQHVLEDLGWIPSPADYLKETPVALWMSGKQHRHLSLSTLGVTT